MRAIKTNKKNKDSLLGELKHRYHILCLSEISLILLQTAGYGCCSLYILSNFYGWKIGDLIINTKHYTFTMQEDYLSPLCFVLSMLLVVPRPKDLRKKINILGSAIKCLTTKVYRSSLEEDTIKEAKRYITEVDRAHQKKREGRENEIKPHEKRMVLRIKMIIFGIPVLIILTFLLIAVLGFTFPQIVAIDMVIGYAMVLYESFYYQKKLEEAHVSVFSEYHKEIIVPKSVNRQQYKFYQKICYMEADRYSNYCLVLGIASSVLNMLAILLTILDASANNDLKRLFAIDSIKVNTEISLLFMGISIIFFILDLFLNFFLGTKIVELKAKEKMEYSTKNCKALEEDWNQKINGKDTILHNIFGENITEFLLKPFRPYNTIFSRIALDICRGKYDYNNDALIEGENGIPADCMLTLEDSFPGKVPRYKFTALVVWLCLFCFFVWGKADINYVIPITIVSLVLYDLIIMFFASRIWNNQWKWIIFEKEMNKLTGNKIVREIKWDFLSYYLVHSFIILFLVSISAWWNESNITYKKFIELIVFFSLTSTIGYRCAKKKSLLQIPMLLTKFGVPILMVMGIICFVIEKKLNLYKLLLLVIIIPVFIEMLSSYFRKINSSFNKPSISVPFCAAFLLINWITAFVWLYWSRNLEGNYAFMLFMWLYIMFAALLISGIVWSLKQMFENRTLE